MKEKLKPCPFCGNLPERIVGERYVAFKCHKASSDIIHSISTVWFNKKYEEEAIKAWNRRAK